MVRDRAMGARTRRRTRFFRTLLPLLCTTLSLTVAPAGEASAAPGDDWSLERDDRDPELVARRFAKLRAKPFDREQWRALEKSLGRKGLLGKIASALAKSPDDPALTILDARGKLARGDARGAAEQLATIEAKAGRWRGRVIELRADALESASAYVELLALLEREASETRAAAAKKKLLERAYKNADRGGLEEAQVRLARSLVDLSPRSLEAQHRLALAASRHGDATAAETAFRAAEKLTPNRRARVNLRLDWANARVRAGDVGGATQLLWETIEQSSAASERELLWDHLASTYRTAGAEDTLVSRLQSWLGEAGHKRDATAWRTLAEAQARSGVDPLPSWRAAADINPRDVETRKALILALDANGQPEQALAEFRKLARDPSYVDLGLELANRMIPNGERDTAMALGGELESMAGRDAEALMQLVDFYNLNDEPERALGVARKLVKAHARDPEARIILGEQLFQMRDEKAALREWATLPKLIRPSHKGWARHAEILSEHNLRQAKDSLQKALAAAPREPNYLRLQALVQTEQRVFGDALKTWQKLLAEAKGPKHKLLRDEARTRVVNLLVEATSSRMIKERDAAEHDALTTLDPPDEPEEALEAGLFLAELYTREQKYRQAVLVHERLVKLDPSNPDRLADLALSQRRAGMADEAMTTLDRLMDADPKRGADLLSELSDLAFESGEIDRVLRAASQAKSQGVDSSEALLRLGELYERRGDLKAAARTYEGLLRARPDDAAAMLHLAELQLTRGQLDEASALFQTILRSPAPPEITRKAFRRALDLAEARDQILEIVDLALQTSKRSAGSTDSIEFLLDVLDRASVDEIRGWLGLRADESRDDVASARLGGLRQALLQALARGPVGARQRAASHLGKLALPNTAAQLARIGAHLSPPRNATRAVQTAYTRARATALEAAGELDDPQAVPVFKELLRSPERFSRVRYAAAWALARSSSPEAAAALRPFVQSRDDSVMSSLACIALARPESAELARHERANMESIVTRARAPHGRHACAYAIAAITPDDALDPVLERLQSSDPIVAAIAAWRLGNIDIPALDETKTRAIITALFRRFIGPNGLARDAAGASLARLLAKSGGPATERASRPLPASNQDGWEIAIERWIRALVAPDFESLPVARVKPYLPELERALAEAAEGTRAEQRAAAWIRESCTEQERPESRASGPRCLAPLVDEPVSLTARVR
ncbi:MAG: tetratricopeptide repeat protein [Myxococcales bacterium]|nr:tetratricopeptide repeat protein [Myxococcales bacterium]